MKSKRDTAVINCYCLPVVFYFIGFGNQFKHYCSICKWPQETTRPSICNWNEEGFWSLLKWKGASKTWQTAAYKRTCVNPVQCYCASYFHTLPLDLPDLPPTEKRPSTFTQLDWSYLSCCLCTELILALLLCNQWRPSLTTGERSNWLMQAPVACKLCDRHPYRQCVLSSIIFRCGVICNRFEVNTNELLRPM